MTDPPTAGQSWRSVKRDDVFRQPDSDFGAEQPTFTPNS
jgi:hypothetical protein